jgi:hypothetical protein
MKYFSRKNLPMILWVTSIILVVLVFTFSSHIKQAQASWYNTGGTWDYRKSIIINSSKVPDTDESAGETDFPVLIDLTDADLQANARSDGYDIFFTSSNGTTKLAHEIEIYTTATGRLTAWVKVPNLSSSADTVIYMYYGNASASDMQDVAPAKALVWSNGYAGVWHLPNGTSLTANDSTGVNNGTIHSVTASSTGKIDGAGAFNGSSGYISLGDPASMKVTTGAATLSGWVNVIGGTADSCNGGSNCAGAIIARSDTSTTAITKTISIEIGGTGGQYITFQTYDSSNNPYIRDYSSPIGTGWRYIVGVRDVVADRLYLYENGVLFDEAVDSSGNLDGAGLEWNIGRRGGPDQWGGYLNGGIDEPRFSSVARSADWIKTEYNNQSATTTFYTLAESPETETSTIALDASSNSGIQAGISNYSWSHTTTGSNLIMLVGVSLGGTNSPSVTSVTYNDVPLQFLRTDDEGAYSSRDEATEIWYLVGPATGTHTVEVTLGSAGTVSLSGAVTLTGVDQSNPIDAQAGNAGATSPGSIATTNITTIANDAWVFDVIAAGADYTCGGINPTSPQAKLWSVNECDYGSDKGGSFKGPIASAGQTSMSWPLGDTDLVWAQSVVSLKPAAPASPSGPTVPHVKIRGGGSRGGGSQTPAFVQGKADGAWDTYTTDTFTSNVIAGNVIAVFVTWVSTSNTLTGITDNCNTGGTSNTYTVVDNPTTSTLGRAAMAYAVIGKSGSCTVRADFSGSQGNFIIIHEISGIDTSSPLDNNQHKITAQEDPGNDTDAVSSGQITTTQNGDYIFGASINDTGNDATPVAGTGFNQRISDTGSSQDFTSEDKNQTSSGNISATFTNPGASWADFITGIMAFKPASGGAGSTNPYVKIRGGGGGGGVKFR